MTVQAPMARPSVRTATTVKPGVRRSWRPAKRSSCVRNDIPSRPRRRRFVTGLLGQVLGNSPLRPDKVKVIGPFRQRSSWPSSFATGLIGWIGLAIIVPLATGAVTTLGPLFLMAVLAAVVQIVLLRMGFNA